MQLIPKKAGNVLFLAVFIAFSAILVLQTLYYLPFISDDALISLRYAQRFIDGKGLTWTEGRPVEGYSNFLWTICVSGLGFMGMDLIIAVRFLGYLSVIATILIVLLYGYRRDNFPAAIIAALYFSLSGIVVVWTIGGLEQPFILVFLAAALVFFFRYFEGKMLSDLLLSSLFLGFLSINRPDGPLFSVGLGLGLIVYRQFVQRSGWLRELLLLAVFPVLMYFGQTLWRYHYYGELVPNTALIKVNFSLRRFLGGGKYVLFGLLSQLPFSVLIMLIPVLFLKKKRFSIEMLTSVITISILLIYIVMIGGDFFPAGRHLAGFVVLGVFLLIEGFSLFPKWWKSPVSKWSLLAAFVCFVGIQFASPTFHRAKKETWEWTGMELGSILGLAFSDAAPVVAVTAAGSIPYSSGLPSLDMLGLNDYWLPRHPPENFGDGLLGHEIGDDNYILRQKPDMIIFVLGQYVAYDFGHRLVQREEFLSSYRPARIPIEKGKDNIGLIYFDKYSPKIGIRKTPDGYIVPGYLMGDAEHGFLYLDGDSVLVSRLEPGDPPLVLGFDMAVMLTDSHGVLPLDSLTVEIFATPPIDVRAAVTNGEEGLVLSVYPDESSTVDIRRVYIRRKYREKNDN